MGGVVQPELNLHIKKNYISLPTETAVESSRLFRLVSSIPEDCGRSNRQWLTRNNIRIAGVARLEMALRRGGARVCRAQIHIVYTIVFASYQRAFPAKRLAYIN